MNDKIIDKIKRDYDKNANSMPLIRGGNLVVHQSRFPSEIIYAGNADEAVESAKQMYDVLATLHSEDVAKKVLGRVVDRNHGLVAGAKLPLLKFANSRINIKNNIELKLLLPQAYLRDNELVSMQKLTVEEIQKTKGSKCCLIPQMVNGVLDVRGSKFADIYLVPATIKQVDDLMDKTLDAMESVKSIECEDKSIEYEYKKATLEQLYANLINAYKFIKKNPNFAYETYSLISELYDVKVRDNKKIATPIVPEKPTQCEQEEINYITREVYKLLKIQLGKNTRYGFSPDGATGGIITFTDPDGEIEITEKQ